MIQNNLQKYSIAQLAGIIRNDWKNVYFGAVPYLDAMFSLNDIKDYYGEDDAKTIIIYFLSNANTWRGPVAKEVKAEFKRRIKQQQGFINERFC